MATLSVKNGVSSISGATTKGSFSYFSGGTRALGPSSVTGFYSGYDAPDNGYSVYKTNGASGFTVTVAVNTVELNLVLLNMGGTGSTSDQNIIWATNTNSVFINSGTTVPVIVTSGLSVYLDAGYVSSYPTSGSTVYDLSGNGANGTLNGTVTWVSSGVTGLQSYFNFATAGDANYISSTVSQNYLDCTVVILPDFTRVGSSNLAGLIADGPNSGSTDNSLRFGSVNGTGPWVAANPGDVNDWVNPSGTTYYRNGTVSNTLVSGWNIFGGYRTNQNPTYFPDNFSYDLGASGWPGRGFQGKIAVVLLYNRKLTATEQLQNYNALKSRFELT